MHLHSAIHASPHIHLAFCPGLQQTDAVVTVSQLVYSQTLTRKNMMLLASYFKWHPQERKQPVRKNVNKVYIFSQPIFSSALEYCDEIVNSRFAAKITQQISM
jgi:6-phosphogluconate dehydrogenase